MTFLTMEAQLKKKTHTHTKLCEGPGSVKGELFDSQIMWRFPDYSENKRQHILVAEVGR